MSQYLTRQFVYCPRNRRGEALVRLDITLTSRSVGDQWEIDSLSIDGTSSDLDHPLVEAIIDWADTAGILFDIDQSHKQEDGRTNGRAPPLDTASPQE